MAAQPLPGLLLVQLAQPEYSQALAPAIASIHIPFRHPAHNPANLHIPSPLLPPETTPPTTPTPPPPFRDRLRDAWDWLTQPGLQPAPTGTPAPAYAGLAWALR